MHTFILIQTVIYCLCFYHSSFSQWEQTGGPQGGWLGAIAKTGDTIFANSGKIIYRSINNGESWEEFYVCPQNTSVNHILLTNGKIFLGTQDIGILLSSDNGQSWAYANTGLKSMTVFKIVASGNKIYAGTHNGILYSTNYGSSWVPINADLSGEVHVTNFEICRNKIAIYGNMKLHFSADTGISWSIIHQWINLIDLVIIGDTIVTSTDSGIVISTDNGKSWINTYPITPKDVSLYLTAHGDTLLAGTRAGEVLFSANRGVSWSLISKCAPSSIGQFAISGDTIFVSSSDGILRLRDNGRILDTLNNGIKTKSITGFVTTNENIFSICSGGLYVSKNKGAFWEQIKIPNFSSPYNPVFTTFGDSIIVGTTTYNDTFTGRIFLSENAGKSWNLISELPGKRHITALFLNGDNIFVGNDNGILHSTNNGTSWTEVNNGLRYTCISEFAVKNRNVFAATFRTGGYPSALALSMDNGSTWSSSDVNHDESRINALAASEDNVFVATFNGLYLSKDNGTSWEKITFNPLTEKIHYILSLMVREDTVYVGTDSGAVILSTNCGNTWSKAGDGLPNEGIAALAMSDGYLFAGTTGRSVWRLPLSPTVSCYRYDKKSDLQPIVLDCNIANNKISYGIRSSCFVQLSVYTLAGKLVSLYKKERQSPGEYNIHIKSQTIPSGLYIGHLRAGIQQRSFLLTVGK